MSSVDRLFVYGSLAPGRANHRVLADVPGSWHAATLRGELHEQGWGAAMGHPAIVPSAEGEDVAGFVLASENLHQHWERLDAFEGDGYERVLVTVSVEGEGSVEAFVYALRCT